MQNLLLLNIGGPEIILILFFGLIPTILIAVCLVDIVRSEFKDKTTKLIWVLIVLFMPVLGPLLYLLLGRNQKRKAIS